MPSRRPSSVLAVLSTLAVLAALAGVLRAPRVAAAGAPAVRTDPERLVNGSAFLVRIVPAEAWRAVKGTFDGREIVFERGPDGVWTAFAGVDFDAPAGMHDLVLHAAPEAGAPEAYMLPLAVSRAKRPTSKLSVPKRYIEPDRKTQERIEREKVLKAELLSRVVSPERLYSGRFALPVASERSEGYGIERLFNGKRQSVHYGLDFRAPLGTPVTAVAAGRVLLARDLFYEGRCVAIDHGLGLLTLYLHFSHIDVAEGAQVVKGQRLGLSGASGRVTGPHLHLAVKWRGLYLDPGSLLALDVL